MHQVNNNVLFRQVGHTCLRVNKYPAIYIYIYDIYVRINLHLLKLRILATPVTLCQGWQSGSNIRTY